MLVVLLFLIIWPPFFRHSLVFLSFLLELLIRLPLELIFLLIVLFFLFLFLYLLLLFGTTERKYPLFLRRKPIASCYRFVHFDLCSWRS